MLPAVTADCFFEAVVDPAGEYQDACLCFRASDDLRQGYQLDLSPDTGLASARRFNEWDVGRVLVQRADAVPAGRPFRVQLVLCGSACEIFIDELSALSVRCFEVKDGAIALEFRDGTGTWSEVTWRHLRDG